jgi:hypothetical protein
MVERGLCDPRSASHALPPPTSLEKLGAEPQTLSRQPPATLRPSSSIKSEEETVEQRPTFKLGTEVALFWEWVHSLDISREANA